MNPADLEILQTALSFIPEEMGVALRRTAYSPNIKERMDASCALFDAEGRIVAQAEHIPVHLGSMPVAVDAAIRDFPGTLREGDQVILNDPYRGGTHLPDVTLIRPVFVRHAIIGFAVNRAHHADIGRSEERRVGKESGCRVALTQCKKIRCSSAGLAGATEKPL